MARETDTKRLLRYLSDAHAAEQGGLIALKEILNETRDTGVRAVVAEHIGLTNSQVSRLAVQIRKRGGGKAGGKSLVNSALAKGSQLLNVLHDKEDKETQDIIKLTSLKQFEAGMYTSLRAYAEAIGDNETAELAATLIGEEREAAEQFERLIPPLAVRAVGKTDSTTNHGTRGDKTEGEGGGRAFAGLALPAAVVGGALLALWGASRLRGSGGGDPSTASPPGTVPPLGDNEKRESDSGS